MRSSNDHDATRLGCGLGRELGRGVAPQADRPRAAATGPRALPGAPDDEIVTSVVEGHVADFTLLMRRYNRRVFRVARGVLRDDAYAEDACQEAWIRAYEHLDELDDRGAFATWLCSIALRCALQRAPRRAAASLDELDLLSLDAGTDDVEHKVDAHRLATSAVSAIDDLIPSYRVIVLLRDVEGLTTTEAASILGISEEHVRVRLHRARARLQEVLAVELGAEAGDIFRFDGERCDRMVGAVVRALLPRARAL